jgi:hypothetical protein
MVQDSILSRLKKTAIFKYLDVLYSSDLYSSDELFDAFSFITELKIKEGHKNISDNDLCDLTEELFRRQTSIPLAKI